MYYDDNKPKYIRYGIYVFIIGLSFLLQCSAVAFPKIFGASAFLLLPVCVCIAMHEREIPAALFGGFCGVVWDTVSATEGFNAIVLMLLSTVCSILISHLMQNNIVTALVLSAGTILVYDILYIIINLVVAGAGNPVRQIFAFYLPSALYTMIFVPVFYYIINKVFVRYKTE